MRSVFALNSGSLKGSLLKTAVRHGSQTQSKEEFRVLNFLKRHEKVTRPKAQKDPVPPPRALSMPTDQNWSNVWTGPRSFHPASVPLPLRQGYPLRNQVAPDAIANAELMKIPNFLHLSPPAIKAQCEAMKRFCTPWPSGLEDNEKCEKLPLEIITSDYCHSGPSIRDPLSRIISVRIKLSHLTLNDHAKDKLLRLVGDRYDETTDYFTIVVDRCPLKQQNIDYALYLLTAVFHESWAVEPWEAEKSEADMEIYIWKNNASKKAVIKWFTWNSESKDQLSDEDIKKFDTSVIPEVDNYETAVSELMNIGENDYQYHKYKYAVKKLLGLSTGEELNISKCNQG